MTDRGRASPESGAQRPTSDDLARRQQEYQRYLEQKADRHMDALEALPEQGGSLERELTETGVSFKPDFKQKNHRNSSGLIFYTVGLHFRNLLL